MTDLSTPSPAPDETSDSKLIERWREAHHLWSVRVNALGAMIMGYVLAFPDQILGLWGMVPGETRALFPTRVVAAIPLVLFGLAILARLVKQKPRC